MARMTKTRSQIGGGSISSSDDESSIVELPPTSQSSSSTGPSDKGLFSDWNAFLKKMESKRAKAQAAVAEAQR